MWGVEALSPDGVTVRVTLKTAPLEQWAVAREMRQRIKARFDYEGIEIPLPQRMVWHRDMPVQEAVEAPAPPASDPASLTTTSARPPCGRPGRVRLGRRVRPARPRA